MLTLTSEYALRAMIHLTRHAAEGAIPGREIAKATGIPPKYLSKILGDLVRVGVLDSSPGKMGGFRLRKSAKATTLADVLAPFEQFDRRRCPFGNAECSDEHPCTEHKVWNEIIAAERCYLERTSVYDVAVKGKRDRDSD